MGLFSKKNSKTIKDEWYLKGVFEPNDHLDKLQKQYEKKRRSAGKTEQLRNQVEGFLSGLEKRNRSRLDQQLKQLKERQKRKDQELER